MRRLDGKGELAPEAQRVATVPAGPHLGCLRFLTQVVASVPN